MDKAIAAAFLEAVTPAGVAASTGAIAELTAQHDARLAGQRLALERARFEAERARRQFDACEPEHRLVTRTLERRLGETLDGVEREQRALAALEHARPAPLDAEERRALVRLARDLPRLWAANTTLPRDRKELLRTLIGEVVVCVRRPENIAEVVIFWEGGARSELSVRLVRRGGESLRTDENTIELIRRLAAHHPDGQIAARATHRHRAAIHPQGARPEHTISRRYPRRAAARSRQRDDHHPTGRTQLKVSEATIRR